MLTSHAELFAACDNIPDMQAELRAMIQPYQPKPCPCCKIEQKRPSGGYCYGCEADKARERRLRRRDGNPQGLPNLRKETVANEL